jgi:hypothetical protein
MGRFVSNRSGVSQVIAALGMGIIGTIIVVAVVIAVVLWLLRRA